MNSKFDYLNFQIKSKLNIDRPTTLHIATPIVTLSILLRFLFTRYQTIRERCLGNHSMF